MDLGAPIKPAPWSAGTWCQEEEQGSNDVGGLRAPGGPLLDVVECLNEDFRVIF